jgi:hypothetical protein
VTVRLSNCVVKFAGCQALGLESFYLLFFSFLRPKRHSISLAVKVFAPHSESVAAGHTSQSRTNTPARYIFLSLRVVDNFGINENS